MSNAATSEQWPRMPDDILLVEDHAATSALVIDLLKRAFPSLSFTTARTAAEAIHACSSYPPRLVIMDIGLPDTNGIEATRRIKALASSVRVLIHSNHDHSVYRNESAAAGSDAFVSKSQTHADLVSTVATLLNISPLRRATDAKRQDQ